MSLLLCILLGSLLREEAFVAERGAGEKLPWGCCRGGRSKAAELTQPLITHLLSAHLLLPRTALGQQARLQASPETGGRFTHAPKPPPDPLLPQPRHLISHGGKSRLCLFRSRYMTIIELLIMSNNFFLKQNLPWLEQESISKRRRRRRGGSREGRRVFLSL